MTLFPPALTPHPSRSTALSPEEPESALEATHYFTEDSSAEGERCLDSPTALLACVRPTQAARSPGSGVGGCLTGAAAQQQRARALLSLFRQVPGGVLTCVSCLCLLDSCLSFPLPSAPLLLLPASPLASDLDLCLPWEAQGQSWGRGSPGPWASSRPWALSS